MISCLTELPLYHLIIYIDRRILWCTHFLLKNAPRSYFRGKILIKSSYWHMNKMCTFNSIESYVTVEFKLHKIASFGLVWCNTVSHFHFPSWFNWIETVWQSIVHPCLSRAMNLSNIVYCPLKLLIFFYF